MATITVPTVAVRIKSSKTHAVINASEFNPDLHEKVDQAEMIKAAKPVGPSRSFRVFKSFQFNGQTYEQGQEYDFNEAEASVVGEKFGCIWPVDALSELDGRSDRVTALHEGTGRTSLTGDEDMETLKTHLAVAQADRDAANEGLKKADGNLGRVTDERDRAQKDRDNAQKSLEAEKSARTKAEAELKKATSALSEAKGENDGLTKQVKDLEKKLKDALAKQPKEAASS